MVVLLNTKLNSNRGSGDRCRIAAGMVLLSAVAFLLLAVYSIFYFKQTGVERWGPQAVPVFQMGQMVKMKAFGHKGMVISNSCPHEEHGGQCTYSVRFSAIQSNTNTRIFGSDGPIDTAPVSVVRGIREYELEAVQQPAP